MTKNEFLELKKEYIVCKICKQTLPIKNFRYTKINIDGTGTCRACLWIKEHSEKIKNSIYDDEVLNKIIHSIFEIDELELNSLIDVVNLDLNTIIEIVEYLKIRNKHYYVSVKCEYCGKISNISPSKYKRNNFNYCSNECYWSDKTNKVPKEKDSIYYNRIETHCTNCDKIINIIPSKYKTTNRYNDNHNFCSKKCCWEYRSKYYIDDKSNIANIEWTDELKNKMRENLIKRMNGNEKLNTKPQKIANDLLDELNIKYEREYPEKYYSLDNYLIDCNLVIEVMGDYWHSNPLKFNKNAKLLNKTQFEGIHRDKLKHSYILNHRKIEILYLWEHDLIHNSEVCKKLIEKYINSQGVLPNYHSFNYKIINDTLEFNEIATPYQNRKIDEYRCILKQAI